MRNCPFWVITLSTGLAALAVAGGGQQLTPAPSPATQKPEPKTKVVTKAIPSPVRYEFSRTVGKGRLVKKPGADGSVTRTYRLVEKNGRIIDKELIQEERVEPTPTLFLMGKSGWTTSRSGFSRKSVRVMNATGYDPSPGQNGGVSRTRVGTVPGYGQVAVDPRVIPLYSLLYVEGYGFAIAHDTGGAIKGNRIDLCFPTAAQANRFGRKKVRVHILKGR